jgi:hypothetical protein
MQQVQLVAPTNASVLITGESGTGKELVARAIQERSSRKRNALIKVNGPYDHAALAGLGLVDAAGAVLADDEVTTRRELAARYLADFGRASPVSARLTRPFRKNEAVRANALMEGEPIDGPPLHKTKSEKPAG